LGIVPVALGCVAVTMHRRDAHPGTVVNDEIYSAAISTIISSKKSVKEM
jgi:hypothetical protein